MMMTIVGENCIPNRKWETDIFEESEIYLKYFGIDEGIQKYKS